MCRDTVAAAVNDEVTDLATKYTSSSGNVTSLVVTKPCELISYMAGLQLVIFTAFPPICGTCDIVFGIKLNRIPAIGVGFEDGSSYILDNVSYQQQVAWITDVPNTLG